MVFDPWGGPEALLELRGWGAFSARLQFGGDGDGSVVTWSNFTDESTANHQVWVISLPD